MVTDERIIMITINIKITWIAYLALSYLLPNLVNFPMIPYTGTDLNKQSTLCIYEGDGYNKMQVWAVVILTLCYNVTI